MTVILGINAYHADAAACLLKDGALVAAAEEERFNRIKHWAGLPVDAIRYCLREGGISLKDVSVIAINSNPRANLFRKTVYTIAHRPGLRLLSDRLNSRSKRRSIPGKIAQALGERGFDGEVQFVEHHLAHLASAFFVSPFDRALALSVDASGDFVSTSGGIGADSNLRIDRKVYFPHSLGIFYEAITQFLGFKTYGDEYKVMGLAAYGRDRFEGEMESLVQLKGNGKFRLNLNYFVHHLGHETITWNDCEPTSGDHFSDAVQSILGPPRSLDSPITQRHKDIACSAQRMFERALFHLVRYLHETYRTDALVLSGGCAFNSLANGKLIANTPVKSIFIQPAAGDAGGALGAALHAWNTRRGDVRSIRMDHAYWGPGFTDLEIERVLRMREKDLEKDRCRWQSMETETLLSRVAKAISEGQVVGWFQGRMEWGPRALGNRSILCDPRRANMKDILNEKIKRRESFRPFAPTILREAVGDWFENDDDVPFMMMVSTIRVERRPSIPAVTHVDGTGRLQTVERHQNPLLYRLIECFERLTGIPMVLNTSFNESEPIVCRIEEAIDCFLRTRMDCLVLGSYLIARERENRIGHQRSSIKGLVQESAT